LAGRHQTEPIRLPSANDPNGVDRLYADLRAEQQRSEALLLNTLPRPILDRLRRGETTIAEQAVLDTAEVKLAAMIMEWQDAGRPDA